MVSVTPDIIASPSFPAPPARAKADAPPAYDSFASLVDSNTTATADSNDRAQDASPPPQQPPSDKATAPSRRDDAAAADKGRDASKADRADRNTSDDRDVAATDQSGTEKPAETGAKHRTKTKSVTSDESNTAEKPAADETEAADSDGGQEASDEASGKTADAVAAAVAVAVAVVATDTQAPAAAPGAATAAGDAAGPLTIAAAALAASNAVSDAATGAAATKPDAAKKSAASAQAGAQTNASEAIATPQGDDMAKTPAVILPVPAPKTTAMAKASKAGEVATSSDQSEAATTSTEAPTANATGTAAPSGTGQPAAVKPNIKNAQAAPAKVESAGTDTFAVTTAHLDTAPHDVASGQSNAPAGTTQGAASFQPLPSTTTTQAQSSFTVTAATQSAAVPLSGLAMEIAASVKSGKSRFEIRLDPADLGRIDVRIDVDRNGQVTSHLTVEKPETLSMLRQDAQQLQRALNDAGLSTGNGGLQFSLRDQSSQGQHGNQSSPNAHKLILTEEEAVPSAVVGGYGRMFGTNGGVDIRV